MVFQAIRKRWLCLVLLFVTIVDIVVADPLPFVDETILAGLTAACFSRHRKKDEPTQLE